MNIGKALRLKAKVKKVIKKRIFDGLPQIEATFYIEEPGEKSMVGILTGQPGRSSKKKMTPYVANCFFVNQNEQEIDRGVSGGINEREAYLLFFRDDLIKAGLIGSDGKLLIREDTPQEYVEVKALQYRISQVRDEAQMVDEFLLTEVYIMPRVNNANGQKV